MAEPLKEIKIENILYQPILDSQDFGGGGGVDYAPMSYASSPGMNDNQSDAKTVLSDLGKWNIKESEISTNAGTVGMSSAVTSGNDVRFWAGGATKTTAPFRVYEDGALVATSATISGTITASALHVPDADTTANSAHVDTTGDTWWGCTSTSFAADNNNANAYILATGVSKFQSVTLGGSVVISGLQAGSDVDGQYLTSLSVTAGAIADATITGAKIALATIAASNIVNATITTTQIASATITSGNIAAGTITGGNIASGTIAGGNIDSLTILAGNIANLTITAAQIANSTITGAKVGANEITGGASGNLALTTITADNIAATTITAAKIVANTITANEIAANTITAAEITAGTITGTEIAATTITAANITAGTITATEMTIATLSAISADLGTITAGTVTGGTLQTASSGSRVVMDTTSLRGINSAGATVFEFNISTGDAILGDDATPTHVQWDNSESKLKIKGLVEGGPSTIPFNVTTFVEDAAAFDVYDGDIGVSGGYIGINMNASGDLIAWYSVKAGIEGLMQIVFENGQFTKKASWGEQALLFAGGVYQANDICDAMDFNNKLLGVVWDDSAATEEELNYQTFGSTTTAIGWDSTKAAGRVCGDDTTIYIANRPGFTRVYKFTMNATPNLVVDATTPYVDMTDADADDGFHFDGTSWWTRNGATIKRVNITSGNTEQTITLTAAPLGLCHGLFVQDGIVYVASYTGAFLGSNTKARPLSITIFPVGISDA